MIFFEFRAQNLGPAKGNTDIQLDNRYGPFHQTIKDTVKRTVSDFGHYFSVGLGVGNDYQISGATSLLSYSMAYKSFLLSVTRGGGGTIWKSGADNAVWYNARYFGVLIGESVRFKHVIFSVSAGIASSNIEVRYLDLKASSANHYIDTTLTNVLSFPIELKLFFLARNGIGFGWYISKNIVPSSQFSPFYFNFSIVFGKWNIKRR